MDFNAVLEIVGYVAVSLFVIFPIVGVVIGIMHRDVYLIVSNSFALLFALFMASAFILGGSAFNNAASDYELYKEGHYYLFTKGTYTEVSRGVYVYMQIIQVVGITGILLDLLTIFIRRHN